MTLEEAIKYALDNEPTSVEDANSRDREIYGMAGPSSTFQLSFTIAYAFAKASASKVIGVDFNFYLFLLSCGIS